MRVNLDVGLDMDEEDGKIYLTQIFLPPAIQLDGLGSKVWLYQEGKLVGMIPTYPEPA